MADFLHNHKDFASLVRIVGERMNLAPVLVEKDYWIMHCLYSLQQTGMTFELKGGTSLSKGYGIINRFSEDIDIRIDPPADLGVSIGRNQNKPAHIESRRKFYDWIAASLKMDGIHEIVRDTAFDDTKYRSGGIRLHYREVTQMASDLKQGVLLEVGFDDVTPNAGKDIGSWAYGYATDSGVPAIDNRALAVPCYAPGYTLVEKLQTISTKYRRQQVAEDFPANFMRHYYDVYCLLRVKEVQAFIGSKAYLAHKKKRFRSENPKIQENEAFVLTDAGTRALYAKAYDATKSLYYRERPSFDEILQVIGGCAERL